MAPKTAVIVPLYIYPVMEETWAPLHQAIASHPDVEFVVVVNPNSGPGEPPFADEDYAREIPKLNAKSNVCTLGYVRTGYCTRDLDEVKCEVATYAGWRLEQPHKEVFVQGIFFDETPNHHTDHVVKYLDTLSTQVRHVEGIVGKRLVINNPGTVPDEVLTELCPEVTAIFEQSLERLRSCDKNERRAREKYDRSKSCYIVHSVPADELTQTVRELRRKARYLFVTDLCSNYYEKFGPSWEAFIEAMQSGG